MQDGKVWHRDASKPLGVNEITRFPHAMLEIKLKLDGEDSEPPPWVKDLQSSGMLHEVPRFSKFLHGCSALLSDDVRRVPYWIDDITLKDSLFACGAERILIRESNSKRTR